MSSTASALPNLVVRPSALAAVLFALGMPRTPERACLALARAMAIQALDTVLASPRRYGLDSARPSNGDPSTRHFGLALKLCRSALRLLQSVLSLQAGSFRAHLSNESSCAPTYCEQSPNSRSRRITGPGAPTNVRKAFASGQHERG